MRLMPRCWYVLLRFWLRVDRVMVRLREVRACCKSRSVNPQLGVLRTVCLLALPTTLSSAKP